MYRGDLESWTVTNFLKLDDEKTECIMFGSQHDLRSVSKCAVFVGNEVEVVVPSKTVRSIGAVLNSTLNTISPNPVSSKLEIIQNIPTFDVFPDFASSLLKFMFYKYLYCPLYWQTCRLFRVIKGERDHGCVKSYHKYYLCSSVLFVPWSAAETSAHVIALEQWVSIWVVWLSPCTHQRLSLRC